MCQLGEAAFASIISDNNGPCPFCESKEKPIKKPPLIVKNDSKVLGGNTAGGRIGKVIVHPKPPKDGPAFEIKAYYQKGANKDESCVGNNAHHIIPGNASFAEVPELHEWLAWKVTFQKIWYDKLEESDVGTSTTETDSISGVVTTHKIANETATGNKRIEREKTTSGNKVYGLVDYNINSSANGIWLPSRNAVKDWSNYPCKQEYAKRAMEEHEYQFHLTHPMYSNSVKNQLKQIVKKIENRSKSCIANCDDSETDPIPAPKRLKNVLCKLSELLEQKKLKLRSGKKIEDDWATSSLSEGFKLPKK